LAYKPLDDYRERVEEIAETFEGSPESLAIYRRVADRVDPERVSALQHKYAAELVDFDPIGLFKYADLPFWLADKVNIVRQLGLDRCEPRTILDIGMGAGHFAAVCQALGHTVVGTDIEVPLYDDICEALELDRRIEPTRLRTPLPDLGLKFDMVTIIWHMFHILRYLPNGDREHWTTDDWAFFFEDLIANHMHYPGILFLYLNPNISATGQAFDAPLMQWCREHGASVDDAGGRILFNSISSWQSVSNAADRAAAPAI
jgi:hypothetical protein